MLTGGSASAPYVLPSWGFNDWRVVGKDSITSNEVSSRGVSKEKDAISLSVTVWDLIRDPIVRLDLD